MLQAHARAQDSYDAIAAFLAALEAYEQVGGECAPPQACHMLARAPNPH